MSIKEIEQLNPSYKPLKKEREITPQEQDLLDIEASKNPKFSINIEDPKYAKLSPAIKDIYKRKFENVSKLLDKELTGKEPELTFKKYDSKAPIPSETIKYKESTVPILTKKDFDTEDQVIKIRELRKTEERLTKESIAKDLEIEVREQRIRALKKELVKEKYDIG